MCRQRFKQQSQQSTHNQAKHQSETLLPIQSKSVREVLSSSLQNTTDDQQIQKTSQSAMLVVETEIQSDLHSDDSDNETTNVPAVSENDAVKDPDSDSGKSDPDITTRNELCVLVFNSGIIKLTTGG
ncbi:hypothetical protein BLNAU_3925 [Blattamonas nauphoetae]|uniref:C2H2-type domain-containing protein n=1 Tax=Blattamonas nauphoetae TaxID=2049346 RepID=A0ABQ9YBM1_9EUKA|nr:hypothetical protein BLNAU_3925 [Blattamonas nauphoetae]